MSRLVPATRNASLAPPPNDATVARVGLKVLLGGSANSIASLISNPMDLIKVRQQLLARSDPGVSSHFVAIARNMIHEEGVLSIFKGISASVVREMTYSGIRMGTYDWWKESVVKVTGAQDSSAFGVKVLAGVASGMLGAAIANPADLIKVRMQAPGAVKRSFVSHWIEITQRSGFRGLYRAVAPTVIRASVLTSSQLASYDETKHALLAHFPNRYEEGLKTHFVASGVAGFVCSVTSAPVDTIKVRLMNDSKKKFRNALQCTAILVKEEGILSLYKGFSMCWLRLWPQTVISLIVFEQLRRLAGIKPM